MGQQHRVYLRHLQSSDVDEFLALSIDSRDLHHPWIYPPVSQIGFKAYLKRLNQHDHVGFVVCIKGTGALAGIININDIVREEPMSASLGYYASTPFAQKGYMHEGLQLVIRKAFCDFQLNRLEANVQPANFASLGLMRRCGFKREALIPNFLFINGVWRDHERWVLTDQRYNLLMNKVCLPGLTS